MRLWRASLMLVLGLAGPAIAQQPQPASPQTATAKNAPESSVVNQTPVFTSRSDLVMVPVVVRDKQGKAVGNLKQEDFQLADKGKTQTITRFSVERPGSASVPSNVATDAITGARPAPNVAENAVPERFIAYLFDDLHLKTDDLMRMRLAAMKHMDEAVDPATRVGVFSTSGIVTLDFTDDRASLRETMMKLMPDRGLGFNPNDCPPMSFYSSDQIRNKNNQQLFNGMVEETLVCASLDPTSAEDRALATQMTTAASFRVLNVGRRDSQIALGVMKDVIRRMSLSPGSRTMILLSPGFFLTFDMRFQETEVMDRAIRANVRINSLDARGLYTIIPGGDASTRGAFSAYGGFVRAAMQQQEASANSDVMAELADATGGKFFHNDNALDEGLRELALQPDYVYMLGFSPQNLKYDGSFHALKVSLREIKGMDIQARRGYYAPNHAIGEEEASKEEIQEAFFSREEMQEIGLEMNLQFFKASDISARLTVLAKIDMRQLRFKKVEDRNNNKLTVVAGVFDRNGNYVAATQQVIDMHLRDQTLEKAAGSGFTVRTALDLTPGTYTVRLVVRDSEGQQMAARNGVVDIPY